MERVALALKPARRPRAHEPPQIFPATVARFIQQLLKLPVVVVAMIRLGGVAFGETGGQAAFRKCSASCTTLSATHSGVSDVSRSNGVGSSACNHAWASRRSAALSERPAAAGARRRDFADKPDALRRGDLRRLVRRTRPRAGLRGAFAADVVFGGELVVVDKARGLLCREEATDNCPRFEPWV